MNPEYQPYHPRWWRPRTPIFWWLHKFVYVKFIVRELTSVPVAYSVLLVLCHVRALGSGPAEWEVFQEWLRSPAGLALNVTVFVFLLIHTITWLSLAPKALVLHVGGRRLPDAAVVGGHYAMWIVASAGVLWYLLGGSG